jgi:hypothetical protein
MKLTDIYQTLENRCNDKDIEEHGPFFCAMRDQHGNLKEGVKEPWLGEGYYFWDTRMEDAMWWGEHVYPAKGYIVCHTQYDQHSDLLYDLVGDLKAFDEFEQHAKLIKEKMKLAKVTFPLVLAYLKKAGKFNFKAIRVWPYSHQGTAVVFPGGKLTLRKTEKVQVCFFDKTLLDKPFLIKYRGACLWNSTI